MQTELMDLPPTIDCGAITEFLATLDFPLYFLDFETFNPALPRYRGSRPYQVIPFQWSLHTLDSDGTLEHREFLHEGAGDPRRAFAESLVSALGDSGPVLVYSGFEASRRTLNVPDCTVAVFCQS